MCEKTRIDYIPTHFLMKVEYLLFIENKFWFFALLFSIFKYLVAGTSNNGWENSPGSIISCESSFAHAGAIVNNESSSIFVTHFDKFLFFSSVFKSYETLITTREDCRMTKSQGQSILYILDVTFLGKQPREGHVFKIHDHIRSENFVTL